MGHVGEGQQRLLDALACAHVIDQHPDVAVDHRRQILGELTFASGGIERPADAKRDRYRRVWCAEDLGDRARGEPRHHGRSQSRPRSQCMAA